MGIRDIHLLFPEGFPVPEVDLDLEVGEPDANGIFTITGHHSEVVVTGSNTFQLVAPSVVDHGDGTYTVSSE